MVDPTCDDLDLRGAAPPQLMVAAGARRLDAQPFDALPLASLVLDDAGRATAVNDAWPSLSGLPADGSQGDGWLRVVAPEDRWKLLARLRRDAATGGAGTFDCRLVGPAGERWSRLWWSPAGPGRLVVCVLDIQGDKAREADLWRLATHDPLTGLVNRAEFCDLLRRAVGRRGRADRPAAVVFLDLDGMKAVNDSAGHAVGDEVLRDVAARLAAAVRPADVPARLGGDEFAVLCEDLHGPEEAEEVARRLAGAVRQDVVVGGTTRRVTASAGVALTSGDDSPEELLARADAAMYEAKRGRGGAERGRVEVAGPARPAGAGIDAAELMSRIFAVGLRLQGASCIVDGPARSRLRQAVDDLDGIVREIRARGLLPPPVGGGGAREATA